MPRILYSLLWVLILPLALLRLCWRARRQPEYLHHVGERLGAAPVRGARPCLWLHAVSVGETRAAQPLIKALLEHYPEHDLLLTHMTPTGRATGAELFGKEPRVRQCYLPYDLPWCVRRFLRRAQPQIGLMMETEVWPNAVQISTKWGVPMLLVNARLSEKSARGYGKLGALSRNTFGAFAAVGAQTEADAQRLRAFGATCEVTGNLKFEVATTPEMRQRGQAFRAKAGARPILLAASTREGEEAMLLAAFARHAAADTLLVLVPRHPQRFNEVAQLVQNQGLTLARRNDEAEPITAQTRVWLGDSMGEMVAYFAMADVAIIGGSWLPLGGQNLIEACAVGVPVILGPHTFNFAQASVQAIEAGAALRCADLDEAMKAAERLLKAPEPSKAMSEAGLRFIQTHRGATQKTMALVAQEMPQK